MMTRLLCVALLMFPTLASAEPDLEEAYREAAGKILGAALVDTEGWEKLEYLSIEIGHRLSGSASLERAIDWGADLMEEEGLKLYSTRLITLPEATHYF